MQVFRMTQKQEAVRVQVAIELVKQLPLGLLVKIANHVSAENDVKRGFAPLFFVHEVDTLKTNPLPQFRYNPR